MHSEKIEINENAGKLKLLDWNLWGVPTFISLIFIVIAQSNFLVFHTLAELVTVIISAVMFVLAWTTFDFSKNKFLLYLACGYFWIAILDLLHVFSYKGMNMMVSDDGNVAVQLWIAARYFESILLLSAIFLSKKVVSKEILFLIFGSITALIFFILANGYFPLMFQEGVGLTPFKIYSEYLIDIILLIALIGVFKFGENISYQNKVLISLAIFMTICAELAFTYYVDVYGLSNLVGHVFKIFSYWLLFVAIIKSNLQAPYDDLYESKEQLRDALLIANQANKAKSDFLANMSHDFRTPLNAILGFSEIMALKVFGPLGDKHYEEYAKDINKSGNLLVSFVDDILDISKVESGKFSVNNELLDIKEVSQLCIKQISQMAEQSKITVDVEVPEDMPPLIGDERILFKIFNNLLSNAIKFTPKKGRIVLVAKVNEEDGIVISVADTGIGMTKEETERVIHPFEQGGSLLAREHVGTGLGLFLCSNFMELFGGTLKVISEVNKGTIVVLNFPQERTFH